MYDGCKNGITVCTGTAHVPAVWLSSNLEISGSRMHGYTEHARFNVSVELFVLFTLSSDYVGLDGSILSPRMLGHEGRDVRAVCLSRNVRKCAIGGFFCEPR